MNVRSFLNFFRTPSGKLILFGLGLGGLLALYGRFRGEAEVPILRSLNPRSPTNDRPQVVETVHRPMELFRPPPPRANSGAVPPNTISSNSPARPAPAPRQEKEPLDPITLLPDTTAGQPQPKVRGDVYAPYGRLIPAETVITVDSSSIQTPIIGLVTEDIFHAGHLVIPAGTELHGSAQVDRTRERIASGTAWTLVWQSGEELRLKGIALDREFQNASNHVGWGITDGSAGLRGRLIKSDDTAELKLFAATFLSGAANALTEKETTLWGAIDSRSLNNAPLKGAEEVLGVYADRIRASIERDGFYIRVPSGKQFYLYVLQGIDRADAHFPGESGEEASATNSPAIP